jgi:pimeloyl-ACP methyl ester carboxylesterase
VPDGTSTERPFRHGRTIDRLLRRAADLLILRPWFDDTTLKLLTRWYFPLSRAWAAGLASNGDAARFLATLPCGRLTQRLLPRILAQIEERKDSLAAAEDAWRAAFFGAGPAHAEVEAKRLAAAQALMSMRSNFAPLHVEMPFPALAWDIESPHSVLQRHGGRLSGARPFPVDTDLRGFAASRGFRTLRGIEGWVRFPSTVPAIGGTAWSRICAPLGGGFGGRTEDIPSVVFAHGIGMEAEYWNDERVALSALVRKGIRVIRPEALWHGRRRLSGTYGGEPILARGPGGLLDFFHAAVTEIGALIAWARATRGGPVAVAGVSLGALTAQLVAVAAHDWPEEMRPDALFLIAPSISLTAVTFEGSLTRGLGVPQAILAAGWTSEEIARWQSLIEPTRPPAVEPERIVVVLGETDDVTLAAGGERLVSLWRIPPENVFRYPAGHFSTSLGLLRGGPPLRRFRAIVHGERQARVAASRAV